MSDPTHTIAALSTPPGESGLAVVRMSGAASLDILNRVFRTLTGAPRSGEWEHRRLYHGLLVDNRGNHVDNIAPPGPEGAEEVDNHRVGERGMVDNQRSWVDKAVDDVMCAVMRAPDTYTGEDIVEVSCHGGMAVVSRVLEALFAAGARAAEPGEFTKRAFLNGKMDLIQAEAVADLIHARSELQRRVARRQLAGGVSRQIETLADEIVEMLGVIEANIDFIEADIDTFDRAAAAGRLDDHIDAVDRLLAGAAFSKPFREGYRAVIAGPVNAGKSTLFNRLVGEERAIVTDIPGTTRDVLREAVILDGLVFVFSDTAGLRPDTGDPVESIGVGLANDAVRSADVVVVVVDGAAPVPPSFPADMLPSDRTIVAWNKTDLPEAASPGDDVGLPAGVTVVETSALTGAGVDALVRALVRVAGGEAVARMAREAVLLNARLIGLLNEAREHGETLRDGVRQNQPLEILALEARAVLGRYEEAIGRRYHNEILDVIFSRFCIGK